MKKLSFSVLLLVCFVLATFARTKQVSENIATMQKETLAALIILEAGGEGEHGMDAVWCVVNNRATNPKRFGQESEEKFTLLFSVAAKPKQFSCFNSVSLDDAIAKAKTHPKWNYALALIKLPPKVDTSLGANHYCSNSSSANWRKNATKTITIGNHVFYKL